MRKVLSWVLCLAMVLGSFSMAFAGTYSDTTGVACDEAVNVLAELGVVNGYEDGTYKPGQVVTRAEASKLIIAALGLTDYASGSTSTFTDMADATWAQGYVGYAQSLGILEGDGNGKFRPSATVNYNEFATMAVRALGYTNASLQGTWPANYVSKAKTLGIMDDITGGGGATGANRGDCAIMLYNALNLPIGTVNVDNVWSAESTTTNGTTVYSDTMYMRLGVKTQTTAQVIKYSDADSAATNITPYIGAYATTLKDKDGNIISVNDVKSTFLTGKLTSTSTALSTTAKFKSNGVEYSVNSDAFTAALTGGAVGFKNAADISDKYADITSLAALQADRITSQVNGGANVTLAVKLSGTTIKEVYSVMQWDPTDNAIFAAGDASDITSDKTLLGVDFPKDDSSAIDTTMFTLNGATSLSAIAAGDVVYVYENPTKSKIARVDVGTQTVSGEVTRVSSDGKTYTIAGTAYDKASVSASGSISSVKAGDQVKVLLDYSGKIYKFEKISGAADTYAVVIGRDAWPLTGSLDTTRIKMVIADGTTVTKTVSTDDVDITGAAFNAIVSNGAIIKYDLNSSGEISDITTTSSIRVDDNTISTTGYINGKKIASDAVIFTYDATVLPTTYGSYSTNSDDYDATKLDKVLDTENVDAYLIADGGYWAAMFMNNASSSSNDTYGVVTKYGSVADSKYEVTMLVAGQEKVYTATSGSNPSSWVNNKVAKLTINASGDISGFNNPATATSAGTKTAGMIDTWNSASASALSITDNVVKAGASTTNISGYSQISLDDNYVVYKLNSSGTFVKGTKSDILNASANQDVKFYSTDKDNWNVATIVVVK